MEKAAAREGEILGENPGESSGTAYCAGPVLWGHVVIDCIAPPPPTPPSARARSIDPSFQIRIDKNKGTESHEAPCLGCFFFLCVKRCTTVEYILLWIIGVAHSFIQCLYQVHNNAKGKEKFCPILPNLALRMAHTVCSTRSTCSPYAYEHQHLVVARSGVPGTYHDTP